jgi:uncharacterized membrane protein YdbT with pleckstrin-like domain
LKGNSAYEILASLVVITLGVKPYRQTLDKNIMSYIDNNLLPGETVTFRTKKHPIVFLVPGVFLILALLFSIDNTITNTINHTLSIITHNIPYVSAIHRIPALIFILMMMFSGVQQWIVYAMSDYVVTNKRIIMREGLLDRRTSDLRLATISSVSIDQGVLAQILNYGNITINGFGGQQDYFIQVSAPIEFQKNAHVQIDNKEG